MQIRAYEADGRRIRLKPHLSVFFYILVIMSSGFHVLGETCYTMHGKRRWIQWNKEVSFFWLLETYWVFYNLVLCSWWLIVVEWPNDRFWLTISVKTNEIKIKKRKKYNWIQKNCLFHIKSIHKAGKWRWPSNLKLLLD